MRLSAALVIVAAAVLLAGCPKKPTTTTDKAATTPVPTEQAPAAATTGTEAGGAGAAKPLPETAPQGAEAAALATTVLYFDYDSSEIRPEYTAVIAAHGKRLSSSPGIKIRLEGHTDERGSPEYNIALGERRAQAVRRALMLQGAADGQATTVSYGEERPAVEGSDESAWAKNRRVEIVVSK